MLYGSLPEQRCQQRLACCWRVAAAIWDSLASVFPNVTTKAVIPRPMSINQAYGPNGC